MVELIAQKSEHSPRTTRTIHVPVAQKMIIHDAVHKSFPTHQTTEIFVEDKAELVLIYEQDTAQHEAGDMTGVAPETHLEHNYRFILGRDAKITLFLFVRGSAKCTLSYELIFEKEGANAQAYGLCFLKDKRTVDISMRQQHRAQNTKSELLVKGILFDESKSVFNGTIAIDACAKNARALLHNKNLVVGEKARAISKPCLEVLADAVQCKHGSAVGSFDPEHLFYLRSRGLSEAQAKNELLKAFVQEILHSVPDQELKNRWQEKIQLSRE